MAMRLIIIIEITVMTTTLFQNNNTNDDDDDDNNNNDEMIKMILISESVLKILLLSIWNIAVFIPLQGSHGIIVRCDFETSNFNRQGEKQSENCCLLFFSPFFFFFCFFIPLLLMGPVILICFCSPLSLPAARKPGQSLNLCLASFQATDKVSWYSGLLL